MLWICAYFSSFVYNMYSYLFLSILCKDQVNAQRAQTLPPQTLEINPNHPVMLTLAQSHDDKELTLAKMIAEQLYDNALIAAGLLEDTREMLPRLNEILANSMLANKK